MKWLLFLAVTVYCILDPPNFWGVVAIMSSVIMLFLYAILEEVHQRRD